MLNFRTRLLILQLLTVILTTVLLGGGSHLLFISSLESLQERHLVHLAREGAKDISAIFQKLSQQMQSLDMETFRQRYGDLPLEKHFLEYFKELPERFSVVSLLDQNGDELVKLVNGQPAVNYFNYRYEAVVQQSRMQPNQTHIGSKLQDNQLGEPTVRLAHSYVSYFGDEFLGTLLVTVPLKVFDRQLIETALGDDASLALVSDKNELLTYNRPEMTFQNLPFLLEGVLTRHQLFGEDLVVVSSPVSREGWQVMATVPWNVYRAETNKMRWLSATVCLLIAVFGAIFSWKITGLLTRNIDQLIEFSEKVGQGDYAQQLPLDSSEEFNRLNNAFNRMVQDLESHRHSRDSLQQIIEAVIDPLIVTDRRGLIVQVNQAVLDLFTCDPAQMINRPLADLFPAPPSVLRRTEFANGLLVSQVSNLETVIRNCGGEEVPVLFSSAPSITEDFGVVCILKDVTELMAVRDSREKALIQAEDARRRVDVLLRSVPDGLVVTDPLGNVLLMNLPAENLLGVDAEKLVLDVVAQLQKESGTIDRSIDIPLARTDSGGLRIVQAHASEVHDARGHITALIMLLRDVSRERSMEQMKNEFISTAAHELRTPLTSILGYSELMLEPENRERFNDDEKQGFLQEILSRAETLARIIDDLLSISRIESGQPLALEIVPTDISSVIGRVVEQFRLTASSHRYELNLPETGRLAQIDAGRLQQALENLLSNAVKYSTRNSLIRVRGEYQQDCYRIVIEDEGIGMTPEQTVKVFDKFYRVDYSNTKTSGLGIGMSIVKQIIDGHAGQIEVISKPEDGTRIVISLPLPAETS